jgi:dimethylhistidine N-methyltransferase
MIAAGSATDLDAGLAIEVRHYLSQTPRQLPSRGLYDPLGSALFDAICELPWYPVTRSERTLIGLHREAILRAASSPARVVELGPGNGAKLDQLLGSPECTQYVHRIELVDVSSAALRDASRRLRENRSATIVTHEARYEDGLKAVRAAARAGERTLMLFLGSNIGNFDLPGAQRFLENIRDSLAIGDSLLIGADLVKTERELLLAYDDPLGVTAAFNKNLLVHLNRALGASFDVDGFVHRAVWNAAAGRVEMHLVSRREQRVDVPAAGLSFTVARDEPIWTESSYKYTRDRFIQLLGDAGLSVVEHWEHDRGKFLLLLATPA